MREYLEYVVKLDYATYAQFETGADALAFAETLLAHVEEKEKVTITVRKVHERVTILNTEEE